MVTFTVAWQNFVGKIQSIQYESAWLGVSKNVPHADFTCVQVGYMNLLQFDLFVCKILLNVMHLYTLNYASSWKLTWNIVFNNKKKNQVRIRVKSLKLHSFCPTIFVENVKKNSMRDNLRYISL